ncbi:hypothetical protein [Polaromonas sp.]|uniref:hypothetical protein n=1 Tax=Polaromonas sp. TaxID=1869339 RepID=UPI00352A87F1
MSSTATQEDEPGFIVCVSSNGAQWDLHFQYSRDQYSRAAASSLVHAVISEQQELEEADEQAGATGPELKERIQARLATLGITEIEPLTCGVWDDSSAYRQTSRRSVGEVLRALGLQEPAQPDHAASPGDTPTN